MPTYKIIATCTKRATVLWANATHIMFELVKVCLAIHDDKLMSCLRVKLFKEALCEHKGF